MSPSDSACAVRRQCIWLFSVRCDAWRKASTKLTRLHLSRLRYTTNRTAMGCLRRRVASSAGTSSDSRRSGVGEATTSSWLVTIFASRLLALLSPQGLSFGIDPLVRFRLHHGHGGISVTGSASAWLPHADVRILSWSGGWWTATPQA